MAHDLEPEEDLKAAIREFSERYLFDALEQARRDGADTRTVAFALLECVEILIDNCYDDLENSLCVGEQLIEGFLRDWRASRRLSSSAH